MIRSGVQSGRHEGNRGLTPWGLHQATSTSDMRSPDGRRLAITTLSLAALIYMAGHLPEDEAASGPAPGRRAKHCWPAESVQDDPREGIAT